MSLNTQNYKGTRDFYPEEMRLSKWMFGKWREVLESFGYEEYDGPVLESFDLYAAKTSEEIVQEQSFNFEDRGGRRVVMRPEMTPTVSRMVAKKRQELGYPLRMYSIPNCFRYERQQRGRLREFWQLNADIFGVDTVVAEIELLLVVNKLMESFGAPDSAYQIRVNSRVLLNEAIIDSQPQVELASVLRLIDNYDKLSSDEFDAKLATLVDKPEVLKKYLTGESLPEQAQAVIDKIVTAGVQNVVYSPTIARGFDYYTDIVFEVFDTNPENNRAMFGGGRYDGLVGEFGVAPVPTVGFGMGDVTFENFLRSNDLIPVLPSETDIYIVTIGDIAVQAQQVAGRLRDYSLNVTVDLSGKKIDKQIKTAEKKGVNNVLFVGESELESGQFKLKNIQTGEEQTVTLDQIPELPL
jgi:histidyl-tRNA synthetase